MQNRVLPIKGGYNFRDIGGYPTKDGRITKWNKIVRSGNLVDLTPQDIQYLKDYGVDHDIDLRSEQEVKQAPDKIAAGVHYQHTPVFTARERRTAHLMKKEYSTDPTTGVKHMEGVYRAIIDDDHARNAYRELFKQLLANQKGCSLFHCSQGKDRTGMAVVMLLMVLGVDNKIIKQDYLLSKKAMKPYVAKKLKQYEGHNVNATFKHNITSLYTVEPQYYDAAMDEIKRKYGSADHFIHQYLNLSDSDIAKLKKIYLQDPDKGE